MSAIGTVALLKFYLLQSLENCIKSVYYSVYYFQVRFLKLKCTENAKSTIKNESKSERKKKSTITDKTILPTIRKKLQEAKERQHWNPQSRKHYRNWKYQENPELEKSRQFPTKKKTWKKCKEKPVPKIAKRCLKEQKMFK